MFTKPQDIVIALKLALGGKAQTYADLGASLGLSASEAHAGVRRLIEARLLDPESKRVLKRALRNFLVHGVPHAFPVQARELTRGIPTAWGAPVLSGRIISGDQLPPVWPDPSSNIQGYAVEPLYPSVPKAAQRDPLLYGILALVDALRIGRARERDLATREIDERLNLHAAA